MATKHSQNLRANIEKDCGFNRIKKLSAEEN